MPQVERFPAQIVKSFTFDAAHHIPTMPEGHKCRRMHGHTYKVEIMLRGVVNTERGYFVDYGDIGRAWDELVGAILDHRVLNEIEGLEIPTTENLALWIAQRLIDVFPHLERVRVYESSTTYCEVSAMELAVVGALPIGDRR